MGHQDKEADALGAITISSKGSFKNTAKFLDKMSDGKWLEKKLDSFGRMGVEALSNATPVDTGLTADSWTYEKTIGIGYFSITWLNTNVVHYYGTSKKSRRVSHYANIAIIVDTGHATGTGGYVVGRHYIEPAIRPVFDKIADELWQEVTVS